MQWTGGHFVRKQVSGVQETDRAVSANGAVQDHIVRVQIRIGEDFAVVVGNGPGFTMLERRHCERCAF